MTSGILYVGLGCQLFLSSIMLATLHMTPDSRIWHSCTDTWQTFAGAALASTPAQYGQRLMPRSKTSDLIAPSLANLPNALSAEYWLKKIQVHEQLGNLEVTVVMLVLSVPHFLNLYKHFLANQTKL